MNAAEILIKAGINSLPTDLNKIAAAFNIKIVSYKDCADCYSMDMQRMYEDISTQGFSFCVDGAFVAAINENACGRLRRHWTIAHELAHILLGHVTKYDTSVSLLREKEADRLAAELLAPLTVLQFCCVSSVAETERLCRLSRQAAEIRFKELCYERRKGSEVYRMGGVDIFTRSEQDRALLTQFLPFISEYITRRAPHDCYAIHLSRIKANKMTIE
ncbi:MAG: ImmA/IrrE family metallo-endopeptidase [Oscillospiraceae bacterium]|nr:ImmA/IrrE family metallo-endopeptidase [Oscillospiraceae bacterium]